MNDDSALHVAVLQHKLAGYQAALRQIEQFGHGHGHGRGFTCANIAKEALERFK